MEENKHEGAMVCALIIVIVLLGFCIHRSQSIQELEFGFRLKTATGGVSMIYGYEAPQPTIKNFDWTNYCTLSELLSLCCFWSGWTGATVHQWYWTNHPKKQNGRRDELWPLHPSTRSESVVIPRQKMVWDDDKNRISVSFESGVWL